MLQNLKMPFSPTLSAPAVKGVVFYNKANDDMIFDSGSDVVIYCNIAVRCVGLNWQLCRNMYINSIYTNEAELLPNYTWKITIPASILKAGFYDVKVVCDIGNRDKTDGICTFGYSVDSMQFAAYQSDDFPSFWKVGLSELEQISLNPKQEESIIYTGSQIDDYNLTSACLPARYDAEEIIYDEVEAFKISFDGIGEKRIYGWLAKPRAQGKFPAMLILPGGGNAPRPRPLEHARHGYVALDIQVHGFDVDSDEYPEPEYNDDINLNPYYGIYLNCIQAVNYLCTRDEIGRAHV